MLAEPMKVNAELKSVLKAISTLLFNNINKGNRIMSFSNCSCAEHECQAKDSCHRYTRKDKYAFHPTTIRARWAISKVRCPAYIYDQNCGLPRAEYEED